MNLLAKGRDLLSALNHLTLNTKHSTLPQAIRRRPHCLNYDLCDLYE